MELSTAFALPDGEIDLEFTFVFIGGLSDDGVDSAELLIGDNDGTCACVGNANVRLGGGDGVTERDSVRRV